MRKSFALLVLTAFALAFVALPLVLAGDKDLKTVTLNVKGMTCSGCKKGVESALLKTTGVEAASVDLETNTATVTYDGSVTTTKRVMGAVKKAGFKAQMKDKEISKTDCGPCPAGVKATTSTNGKACCAAKKQGT